MDAAALEPYMEFVRRQYLSKDSAHDFRHIERIASRLPRFSEGLSPPPRKHVLYFLTAYHGLAVKLREDEKFRQSTIEFLLQAGWSRDDIEKAFASLYRHLSSPQTVEEQVVHDANFVEMLGSFGIAKAFTTGGARFQSIDETAEIYEQRYLNKIKFCTPAGRAAAQEGRQYVRQFLARLKSEL